MGNWDLVVTYDEQAASWLATQGFARPAVIAGNRMPTVGEVNHVLREGAQIEIELQRGDRTCDHDERVVEPFRMRGDYEPQIRALVWLSQRCGQLWLYPDTGLPAIVIVPSMDAVRAASVFREAHERGHRAYREGGDGDEAWRWLHAQLYAV